MAYDWEHDNCWAYVFQSTHQKLWDGICMNISDEEVYLYLDEAESLLEALPGMIEKLKGLRNIDS